MKAPVEAAGCERARDEQNYEEYCGYRRRPCHQRSALRCGPEGRGLPGGPLLLQSGLRRGGPEAGRGFLERKALCPLPPVLVCAPEIVVRIGVEGIELDG